MSLDTVDLAADMLKAFLGQMTQTLPEIQSYAKAETKKLAESLAMIEEMKSNRKITKEEARLHLEIQKNATRSVLLTIEGLGVLAVEKSINAALDAVRETVNTALKFTLL